MTATLATKQDAQNRALRTFLQSLAVDVLIALGAVGYEVVSSSSDVDWKLLGLLLAKTALTVLFSYLMRLKYDPLSPPLPDVLPPADPGPPADPSQALTGRSGGHAGHDYEADPFPETRMRRAVRPPVPLPPDLRTPGYAAHAHPEDVETEADRQARRNEPG
jgi:hypothetical protein